MDTSAPGLRGPGARLSRSSLERAPADVRHLHRHLLCFSALSRRGQTLRAHLKGFPVNDRAGATSLEANYHVWCRNEPGADASCEAANVSQASAPPSRGRPRPMPCDFNRSAARALEASLGQLQTRMISRSRGISWPRTASSPGEIRMAPGMRAGSPAKPPRRSTIQSSSPAPRRCCSSAGVMRATSNCLKNRRRCTNFHPIQIAHDAHQHLPPHRERGPALPGVKGKHHVQVVRDRLAVWGTHRQQRMRD